MQFPFFDAEVGGVWVDGHGHAKGPAIEALVEDAQAGAIEKEHFEGGAAFAEKHIQGAVSGISLKMFGDDATEALEAPVGVDGGACNVYIYAGRDHGVPLVRWRVASTPAKVDGSKPGSTTMRASSISITMRRSGRWCLHARHA